MILPVLLIICGLAAALKPESKVEIMESMDLLGKAVRPKVFKAKSLVESSTDNLRTHGVKLAVNDQQRTDPMIEYHGGHVMMGTVGVYSMWLGSGDNEYSSPGNGVGVETRKLVTHFLRHIGGSEIYSTIESYYNKNGVPLSNSLNINENKRIYKGYTKISDKIVQNLILDNINSGEWEMDTNVIYTAFFQGGLEYVDNNNMGSFGVDWCGYHSYFKVNSGGQTYTLKYQLIGDANFTPQVVIDKYGASTTALDTCTAYSTGSVNGNPGADGK
jgi:hypothetical protein